MLYSRSTAMNARPIAASELGVAIPIAPLDESEDEPVACEPLALPVEFAKHT